MITIIMGGLYGSEGKGSVASVYASRCRWDLVIRTGSPNAGHTFKKPDGTLVKMRQLPATWCYAKHSPIYVPVGAIINKDVLLGEARMLRDSGFVASIYVSPLAVVIQPNAMERERNIVTGTTGEGIGATRADRCMRKAVLVRDDPDFDSGTELGQLVTLNCVRVREIISNYRSSILIEATQGFGLSLYNHEYPFVTSTNLTVHHILDDAEIPFNVHSILPVLVVRVFPIRIAGNSGSLVNETTWKELRQRYGDHIPDEQTTVTKKTRRVGGWDRELVQRAIANTNPAEIVLTFADYVFPNIRETGITVEIDQWLKELEGDVGRSFTYLGIGIGEFMSRDGRQIFTPDDINC